VYQEKLNLFSGVAIGYAHEPCVGKKGPFRFLPHGPAPALLRHWLYRASGGLSKTGKLCSSTVPIYFYCSSV